MHRHTRQRVARLAIGGLAMLSVIGLPVSSAHAAATTQVVRALTTGTWFGFNEGPVNSVGTTSLVYGPGSLPAGSGSAKLTVDGTGRASLATNQFAGTKLANMTGLTYWAYSAGTPGAGYPVVQFDADYNLNDTNTAFQGRLSYIAPSVPANTWTQLDALNGTWWATGAPGNGVCTQASPCTKSQLTTAFPNVGIRNDPIGKGALLIRLGGPVPGGQTVYADVLTFSTTTNTTITDFEAGATVLPSIAPAGSTLTITAGGFKANKPVKFIYYTNANKGKRKVVLCKTTSNASGNATCIKPIPTPPGPDGVHQILIKGRGPTGNIQYTPSFVLGISVG
jgi:hypothetical protein